MGTIGFLAILMTSLILPETRGEVRRAVLHGFSLGDDTVTIHLSDCGCTEPDHFSFLVERAPGGGRRVTVLRLQPDHCEMLNTTGAEFEYSLADANLEGDRPVVVLNRFRKVSAPVCR